MSVESAVQISNTKMCRFLANVDTENDGLPDGEPRHTNFGIVVLTVLFGS